MTAVCDEDLTALIISGIPKPDELLQAWNDIFLEYLDMSAESTTRQRITLEQKIEVIRGKELIVKTCLYHLNFLHHQSLVDTLHTYVGFKEYKLDPTDLEQYNQELNAIQTESMEMKIDRELMEIELQELVESEGLTHEKKATRVSFLNTLARIATHKHVAVIRAAEITVAEFCAMFNEYLDSIKAMKPKTRKPLI